eukprot:TCALIF_07732-PA protein Name:"Similar to MAFK Transcription factor MafK (Gallus gallus)" AED:0.09 eAED:0.09 QI:0/0.66/0.5/1/0.33/0.5/4/828/385
MAATSAVDVGAVVAPTSSNSQQIQQLGPFRTHVGDEEEVLVGAPGLDNGHGLQLVGVHHEDEDSPRARYNRSAVNPALYHHNPHHGQSIHACDPLGDPDYQDACLDQHPVRFHRDEYAHQYSPQSRSNGDWPGQHLGNQIPQWIDGRAGGVWHPPPVPMGPGGTDQRFVVGNQSHMKWMEQSRPGSAMSNTGSGKMKGVGSRSLLYEPMASDCIPDDQLAQLSVKELNKRVQNLTRDDIVKLKQRRRTLKNRGYAMNCRLRRQMHKEGLESQLNDMRDRFYNALKERDAVIKERDYLRNQLNQLEKLQASGGLVGPTTSNNGGSNHHDTLQLSLAHSSHHPGHHHAGQLDLSLNGNDGSHNYKRSPNTYGSLVAIHHQETAKLMR